MAERTRSARNATLKAAKKPSSRRPSDKANIKADTSGGKSASQMISARIAELGDWRGDVLGRVRKLIREADPAITEEIKWRKPSNPAGVPVWSHETMVCTGEVYKDAVKLTFANGASLKDPAGLFNSSLDGNLRRAIDIRQEDRIDESAFKDLIRAAVSLNLAASKK